MSRVLIGTNVLIYLKDEHSIHHSASLNLISGNYKLFTTSKNLVEYYSVVTRGEFPLLRPEEALADLNEFTILFKVLYPSISSQRKLNDLISSHSPKGLLIHDFEIASIAMVNGILKIATFKKRISKKFLSLKCFQLNA